MSLTVSTGSPGLRFELVSNAYDADAEQVVIKTDRPRFESLSVEDDGIGMTPAVLAHLLHHIGGSAKRSLEGVELGIASRTDPTFSPVWAPAHREDRRWALLSRSADTPLPDHHKDSRRPFRTVASVVLRQYSDDGAPPDENHEYEAGLVKIWREPATDARVARNDDHPDRYPAAYSRHAP